MLPLYRGTIDYSPTRLTSTNISFLPCCLSKVICAVGETPPYPHVCFIGSDRIIPLVHIINHSLLSPCRKHLVFLLQVPFLLVGLLFFFLVRKSKEKFEEHKIWKDILKRILHVLVFASMTGPLSSIYTADVVKGQIASYWCFEWLLIKCPEN